MEELKILQELFKTGDGTEGKQLQDILNNPKFRGRTGEYSLKSLLEQILPKDTYKLKHTFNDGKVVDAIVQMGGFWVPIAANFPLPSFQRMVKAETNEEKSKLCKKFLKDVTAHIDKVASDYIRPAEGTQNFALLYIPIEEVYDKILVNYVGNAPDILNYSLDKKVVIVTPNLLYVYLLTVVMGLNTESQITEHLRHKVELLESDVKYEVGAETEQEIEPFEQQRKNKSGRKPKYTPDKIRNMKTTFNKHFEERNDVKYAWECVAEEHGIRSAKAAEMAVRRYRKKNK